MAALQRFFGVERGVNTAKDNPCAALARQSADLVATQGVAGVNADADKVSRPDARWRQRFERLVHDDRIAKGKRGCACQHIEPPWGDYGGAKRMVAGIDEKYSHTDTSFREAVTCCRCGLSCTI
jgi:hypothetical protein